MNFRAKASLLALSCVVAGCGGAATPEARVAAEPESRVEPEPTTVPEAEAQIARLEEELGGRAAKAEAPRTQPPAPTQDHAPAESTPGTACVTPCRAVASMRRAVEALCRMTGETDARCVRARHTLAESVDRVRSCSCH